MLQLENIKYLFARRLISSPIYIVDMVDNYIIIYVFYILHWGESLPNFKIVSYSNIKEQFSLLNIFEEVLIPYKFISWSISITICSKLSLNYA
jgi:hypothetical protein